MNEIRDIILGIDFGKVTSQLCYFDRKKNEAVPVSMKVGAQEYEIPTLICRRVDKKDFVTGIEAEYFAREHGGILVDNLFELCAQDAAVSVGDVTLLPGELLAVYLKDMMKYLGVSEPLRNIRCLGITVEKLDASMVRNLRRACQVLGFREEQYQIMDYGESFYYYAMRYKKEIWNRHAGWYHFEGNTVSFRKLHMNVSSRPVLVKLEPWVRRELKEKDKDLDFYQFIQDTLRTEPFAHIYITGRGFDQSWAVKSCGTLRKNQRRVFAGDSLNAMGACESGKERMENHELKNFLYLSDSMVTMNVGMDLIIQGIRAYYPLVEAGHNWYECRKEFDIIPDDTEELLLLTSPMGEKKKTQTGILLTDLPKRPNRTTRLRVSVCFVSQEKCRIEIQDLGFGEMFPSDGKVWTEEIEWQ